MEFHVINATNAHLYLDVLDRFFKVRHDIYVGEKGWREPDPIGREIDQFDTPAATYIVGLDNGTVVAGSRLIPTTAPTMLSDVFPHLADGAQVTRRADIAEWTRGFVVPSHRGKDLKVTSRVCGTVMDYCLREGITSVGGVQDAYWLPLWRRYGWTVQRLGDFHEIAGRKCLAAFCHVSEFARDMALIRGGLIRSPLVHEGPYQPFIPAVASNAGGNHVA